MLHGVFCETQKGPQSNPRALETLGGPGDRDRHFSLKSGSGIVGVRERRSVVVAQAVGGFEHASQQVPVFCDFRRG